MRQLKKMMTFALGALTLSLALASCGEREPRQPQDESKNLGHDVPFGATITLTECTLSSADRFDHDPSYADATPTGRVQQIIFTTNKERGWHIADNSPNQHFEVKSIAKSPMTVYRLDLEYRNGNGIPMNKQFIDNGQNRRHQHFFGYYDNESLVREESALPFRYRYADTTPYDDPNGKLTAKEDPIGFKGLIRFVEPRQFQLKLELIHASDSKYESDGSLSPYYAASRRLRRSALDASIGLKFVVDDAQPVNPGTGGEAEEVSPEVADITKVVVKMYEGHLHSPLSYHYVAGPKNIKSPNLRLDQTMTLKKVDGKWVPDTSNGGIDKFIFRRADMYAPVGGTGASKDKLPSPVYGVWLEYYDASGREVQGRFASAGEYQHFFIARRPEVLFGQTIAQSALAPDALATYLYRDTTPWDGSGEGGTARFNSDNERVGLKGFVSVSQRPCKFDLDIELWSTPEGKLSAGAPAPYHTPSAHIKSTGKKVLSLSLPIYVLITHEEYSDFDAKQALEDYPEPLRSSLRKYLELLGCTWEDFGADMENLAYGERGDESEGVWF